MKKKFIVNPKLMKIDQRKNDLFIKQSAQMHGIGQMSEQVSNHQRLSSPISSLVVRNPKKNTLKITIMYSI